MVGDNKALVHGKNRGHAKNVSGKLVIIHHTNDLNKVVPGTIVVIKESALSGESLLLVYRSCKKGAIGIVIERIGKLDHGVIAAKELGIPALVLSDYLEGAVEGESYTIQDDSLYQGVVLSSESIPLITKPISTKHKVKLNVGFPETIIKNPSLANLVDGVAFARLEFCLLDILDNIHPIKYVREKTEAVMAQKLAATLEPLLQAFRRKPVWFRTDDFATDQLLQMEGGQELEEKESSSMLGWRGIRRSIEQTEILTPQFKAMKILIDKGYDNIGLFPPMVSDISEYKSWLHIAHSVGLTTKNIQFGLMVETPACALTIEDFLDDISFVVFGTNDLTQFTLAVDRSNPKLTHLFDEKKPAVLKLMEHVISHCAKRGIETSVGGQAGSDPALIKILLEYGLSGTSLNPDFITIDDMRRQISVFENGV